jgi:hypothetical protein
MAHKGSVSVATSVLLNIASEKGAKVEKTSGYLIITKEGDSSKQVLVENFVKKGSTESITRWIELRGKGKVPYISSSPGVIEHNHSSPSISRRLDTDSTAELVASQFALLLNDLLGIVPAKVEEPSEEQAEEAAA